MNHWWWNGILNLQDSSDSTDSEEIDLPPMKFSAASVKEMEHDLELHRSTIVQTQTVLSIDGAVVTVQNISNLLKGCLSVKVGFS